MKAIRRVWAWLGTDQATRVLNVLYPLSWTLAFIMFMWAVWIPLVNAILR
jgi:hypothetical protein